MRIVLAADHAAIELKTAVAEHLRAGGHAVTDLGCHTGESVDYPDYAVKACGAVTAGQADVGVLLCGSGIGMAIAANKVAGIRAALLHEPYSAKMSRVHNDANVVCFGARVTGPEVVKACLDAYLGASFGGGNHTRRVEKINAMDRAAC
jgi:ribose 5-phosphate isomerase B